MCCGKTMYTVWQSRMSCNNRTICAFSGDGIGVPTVSCIKGVHHSQQLYIYGGRKGILGIRVVLLGIKLSVTQWHRLEMLKHFGKWTKTCTACIYCLLVLNGHKSHCSSKIKQLTKADKIITLCLPPLSSHLMWLANVSVWFQFRSSIAIRHSRYTG